MDSAPPLSHLELLSYRKEALTEREARLLATVDSARRSALTGREVLVLIYSDGRVEAYGNHRAKLVVVPECWPENEEEMVDCVIEHLPKKYRALWYWGGVFPTAQAGSVSLDSFAAGKWAGSFAKELNRTPSFLKDHGG